MRLMSNKSMKHRWLIGALLRWPMNGGFRAKPGRYPAKESSDVQTPPKYLDAPV